MDRKQFLDKLELVGKALATSDTVPILNHIWFTGTQATAYNGQIAISVPCKTDFSGAVPGEILIKLMRNSKAKAVEFASTQKEVSIKAASAKLKLAMMPPSNFIFEMPAPTNKPIVVSSKSISIFEALKLCLQSAPDTLVQD